MSSWKLLRRVSGGVVSYTIPESPTVELSDISYDGKRLDNLLTDGLGRLVDGEVGADNYRLDMGDGRGTGWVAWMRDTFVDDYVELVFEFEVAWIFEAVHIYTNNYFSRDVQVFSKADVWFSVDGATYEEEPLSYSYIPDIVLENARNVSIGLHERHGRFVKMHLYFAGRWIMISEVTFEGITAAGEGQEYLEVLIGVLTAIILLLLLVFVIVLLLNRRQKLQSSPTVLKNPFGFAINMKGLLLNLTPGGMLTETANHVSPDMPEDGSMHESLTMEQFNSPLVSPQYKSTYAIVATSESPKDLKDVNVSEESVRLDTRPESTIGPASCSSSPTNSPARHSQHYRTLQSYTSPTAKLNIAATSNHQRDVDQIHSKRWHTAPKEKHKIPAPVVGWNIAPSMNKPYKCKEIEPTNIPRQCLRTTEKLGSRNIGE
ncbi:unnamed protein product, partial [Heterotrigona itama]